MRAVVLREPGRMEMAEVPKPRLTEEHHVLIRVDACGICGSDLRYAAGENPWALHTLGRHVPNPPNIILGHEFAGVVTEVNSPAYEHWLGRRAGAQSYRVCGECRYCRSGRENLCRGTIHTGHGQGWGQMDYYPGAYAEYCLAWGDLLYPIPDHVASEDAAMADVFCVAVHAVGRNPNRGGNVLCIGGGPVGLSIAQVAKAKGAREVVVSDPSPVAQQVLRQYADLIAIDPADEPLAGALKRRTGEASVTAIYNTVGGAESIVDTLPLLEESGTYVNVAVHDEAVTFSAAALGAERALTSSSNALYRDVAEAYELICGGKVNVAPMITHRFALEDFAEGFELLCCSPKKAFKVVLRPHGAAHAGGSGVTETVGTTE